MISDLSAHSEHGLPLTHLVRRLLFFSSRSANDSGMWRGVSTPLVRPWCFCLWLTSGNDIRRYADRGKNLRRQTGIIPAGTSGERQMVRNLPRGSHRTAETSVRWRKPPDLRGRRGIRGISGGVEKPRASCRRWSGKKRRVNERSAWQIPPRAIPHGWWYIPSFPADGRWRPYLG